MRTNHELTAALKHHGYNDTQPRQAVYAVLKAAPHPLATNEIVRRASTVDKTSVYRTIELFQKLRLIEVITQGWKQKYELAAPFRPHHHHLICQKCGAIEEIHSKTLEQVVAKLANAHDFQATGHLFEISGLCKLCKED